MTQPGMVVPRGSIAGALVLAAACLALWAVAIEAHVAQAGDIQIATTRAFPVLVEYRLGIGVGKQPFAIAVQPDRQATCKVDDDFPVVTGLAGCRDGGQDARDATLGIRYRAVLFAPAAGR